ncbi:MAG TPA: hypothetical protein VE959_29695 [Bryobacteraceae bacterium]|nr:hypothetical protein [Bryobacteraceae bacterium]
MKKSARVTLTVVAAVGWAARAQQAPNPCEPANFNGKACQAAVKNHGYCSGGAWVPQQYQKYPYYYGLYQAYASAAGVVTAAPVEACRRPSRLFGRHGGFGAIGAAVHGHSGS